MLDLIPALTGNKLQNYVLYVLACVGSVYRDTLLPLASYTYLRKALLAMRDKHLIRISTTRPSLISLSLEGKNLMRMKCPAMYDYYMAVTHNDRPGCTEAHKRLREQAAMVTVAMLQADIGVGPCSPAVQDVLTGHIPSPSLDAGQFFFWHDLMKLRDAGVKEAREQISRSVGVLLTPATRSVVYCLPHIHNTDYMLTERAEYPAHALAILHTKRLCGVESLGAQSAHSIVIAHADDMLSALQAPKEKGKKKNFGAIAQERKYCSAHLHFVPVGCGTPELMLLANHSGADIKRMIFEPEEIIAAGKYGPEAMIKGLACFEVLSGDLSKLMWVHRTYKDISRVGIGCWEHQVPFIKAVLGDAAKIRARKE